MKQAAKTKARRKSAPAKKRTSGSRTATRKSATRWSADIILHSNALDLKRKIFLSKDPAKIAASLKRSAEKSTRKKGTPLQSAMCVLNFYINRAGKI